jgi:hypothetical protein
MRFSLVDKYIPSTGHNATVCTRTSCKIDCLNMVKSADSSLRRISERYFGHFGLRQLAPVDGDWRQLINLLTY